VPTFILLKFNVFIFNAWQVTVIMTMMMIVKMTMYVVKMTWSL